MELKKYDERFSICKIADVKQADLAGPFYFLSRTDEELSLVCLTEHVPAAVLERNDGWRMMRIEGQLDFSLIGILAGIADVLAAARIGIFVVSTYNTDYIFVKEGDHDKALDELRKAGYQIV